MRKPRVISVDLDSTVADTSERFADHSSRDKEEQWGTTRFDWGAYARDCYKDKPLSANITALRLMAKSVDGLIFVSGREASALEQTRAWIKTHFGDTPILKYFLADGSVEQLDHAWYKSEMVRLAQEEFDVVLHVDDWREVKDAVERRCKVPVMIVDPCYPARDGHPKRRLA